MKRIPQSVTAALEHEWRGTGGYSAWEGQAVLNEHAVHALQDFCSEVYDAWAKYQTRLAETEAVYRKPVFSSHPDASPAPASRPAYGLAFMPMPSTSSRSTGTRPPRSAGRRRSCSECIP